MMQRILVIRLSAIGDVILASAPLLNLKISHPEAKIYLLTREKNREIAGLMAGVDEVIPFPENVGIITLYRIAEELDKIGFDAVIDLHGNFRSFFLSHHLAGLKVRYPKRRWERWRATRRGDRKVLNLSPPHTIDLYNQALHTLGSEIHARRPVIQLPPASDDIDSSVARHPRIALAPGASFPTKQWFPDRFEKLAFQLHEKFGAGIVVYLSENDRELFRLREKIPKEFLKFHENAPLPTLAASLRQVDLLISNDSALAHLGSAVGTPVLALFGPTHPTLGFAPRGLRDRVIQVDEYCRPCSLHGRTRCYREEQYCFTRIGVDDVMASAAEYLQGNFKGTPALFVDRDGTLIKEKEFIRLPEEVEPEEGAIDAIKAARQAGFKIIVISNQSGVARGYFDEETVRRINHRVKSIFRDEGAPIDDIYYCPHYIRGTVKEYAVRCHCRKPSAGMVDTACLKHNLNPFRSIVIGDKISDIELAYVSGARGILVQTGYGKRDADKLQHKNYLKPEYIAERIGDAVKYLTGSQ
ncbi:MAG: HAD-IIIA family hydrolase [bacterium]|jgi:histidinol-phosphate phosphatase family protein